MLSDRLVQIIQDHAGELTQGVLNDLAKNPRTAAYHMLPRTELHNRVYDVYRNLGQWITEKAEGPVSSTYMALGRTRRAEGIPLQQVVQALIVTKRHIVSYVRSSLPVDTAVELHQEEELNLMLGRFFDNAIYFTVKGYEQASVKQS
jgi:hypothetical protein